MITVIIAISLIMVGIFASIEFGSDQFPASGIIGFVCLVILFILTFDRPQAIDVYKGKTTLEVTYRDSIPVDSTVIFKHK